MHNLQKERIVLHVFKYDILFGALLSKVLTIHGLSMIVDLTIIITIIKS